MSKAEKSEWREITKCKPAEWMTREKFPLLEAYCTHAVARRYVADKYRECMDEDGQPQDMKRWSDIHSTETAKLQSLGIRLEIAQSTSYERSRRAKKPKWES